VLTGLIALGSLALFRVNNKLPTNIARGTGENTDRGVP
jgi:hypothetical protein